MTEANALAFVTSKDFFKKAMSDVDKDFDAKSATIEAALERRSTLARKKIARVAAQKKYTDSKTTFDSNNKKIDTDYKQWQSSKDAYTVEANSNSWIQQ